MRNNFLQKQLLLLCFCVLICSVSFAQYILRNPAYKQKESSDITFNAVRIYSDSLILDLTYTGSYRFTDPGFYVNSTSKIEFAYGGNRLNADWKGVVSGLVNAKYRDITHVAKGATHNFSVIFPFSLYKLLGDKVPVSRAEDFFNTPTPFAINFINCDDSYRRSNSLSFGDCFDIYKIDLQMQVQNWAIIWCKGFLKSHYIKDEFETTVKYRERISASNTRIALTSEIRKVYRLFAQSYLSTIDEEVPQIKYDSDTETFSVKYTGAEIMSVSMPISVAPSFKQRIIDKTLTISNIEILNYTTGDKYINAITYSDKSGKKTTIENKLNVRGSNFDAVADNIIEKLKSTYPDL